MSDQILLGTRKGTLILDRLASGWQARTLCHPGVSVSYASGDPRDGTLWAALDHGHWGPKLSRSNDGGETWKDVPQIKYPAQARFVASYLPGPDDPPENPSKKPEYKDAKLLKLWVIAFGGADQPGTMHIGTIPGGLFTSHDGGESFELNRELWNHESRGGDLFAGEATSPMEWGGTPAAAAYGEFAAGIHSVVIDPTDSRHMYIAVSCAGVLESTDAGKTWLGRNQGMLMDYLPEPAADWGHDPHFVSICPGQPEHLWQQNHCGVFYSSDAAKTWKKVSNPDQGVFFGFPVAVDAQDGRTAWVVPAQGDAERVAVGGGLFVGRSQDGGESWECLREGLPQEHAYDIVYRHALDVSGDRLCFGSTTGNVFVSEDRGESWRCLGHNFPPVHSVRFL